MYEGRRYWIFQNDLAKPFQSDPANSYSKWDSDSDILVYHREFDSLVACGKWVDGVIHAETL